MESKVDNFYTSVHTESRGIEIRDKDTDIRVEKETNEPTPASSVPCPLDEIQKLCNEICMAYLVSTVYRMSGEKTSSKDCAAR